MFFQADICLCNAYLHLCVKRSGKQPLYNHLSALSHSPPPLPLNDRLKSASRNDFSFKQWPGRLFNLQLKGIKIINSFSKSQQQKPGHLCLAGLRESECLVLGEAYSPSILFFFFFLLNY